MENVRKFSAHTLARACIILILSIIFGLSIASASLNRGIAYADNEEDIGESGGSLDAYDNTEYPKINGVTVRHIGPVHGVDIKITAPKNATQFFVGFEVFSNDPDDFAWSIRGNDYEGEDYGVPFMRIIAQGDNHDEFADRLFYQAEWTAPALTAGGGSKTFTVTVHGNGEFYVLCRLGAGSEELFYQTVVNTIDWNPPSVKDVYGYKFASSEGGYALNCKAEFSDNLKPIMDCSISGLAYAAVFRTDEKLTTIGNPDETPGYEIIADYPRDKSGNIKIPSTVLQSYVLDFEIKKDGYYYYYVMDRMGNSEAKLLFGEEKTVVEVDDRFSVTSTINGNTVTQNVEEIVLDYGSYIENNKDKVNASLYQSTLEAYSTLMLNFMSGDDDISEKYWGFVRGAYKEYEEAVRNGATYTTNVINDDILFGKLTVVNFDGTTVMAKGGDDVKVEISVAKFRTEEVERDLVVASGITGANNVYRLNYKLTVNGSIHTVPEEALIFNVDFGKNVEKVALVVKSNGVYVDRRITDGVSWVRFETSLNSAEFYLVTRESDGAGDKLLPLWITLGVVGGLGIIAAIVLPIILKKKKLANAKKNKAKNVEEGATEGQSQAQKKPAANKSKKKKKK